MGTGTSGMSARPARIPRIHADELQIIKYVHELGTNGIRSYSTGFLIQDYAMTLWYMDRMGVVKSVSFDFIEEPHFLLLYLAAIKYASPQQLRFFPLLQFPEPLLTPYTLENYKDVVLDLSGCQDMQSTVLADFRLLIDVDKECRPLILPFSSIGRATIVIPAKAHSSSKAALSLSGTSNVVVKISWQSKWRQAEDQNVRVARQALESQPSTKTLLKHIVDLKCSLTRSMAELGLPRAFMTRVAQDDDYERVCRILVMAEYLPLSVVSSAEHFKVIYLGAVRGMYAN